MLTPYYKGNEIYTALINDLAKADSLLKNADVANNLDIKTADITIK
jgi:hypothetical protein